jgi:hypothetical protein
MFGLFKKKNNQSNEDNKKDSNEPWVQVVGDHVDAKGIKIELDWNDAFVTYLKNNGYSGVDDETIVQKWVAHMYKHVMENMNDTQTSKYE